jgi:hypothetical protein
MLTYVYFIFRNEIINKSGFNMERNLFLLSLCMMCYLQLHNTRVSSIFMCFSFFFVCDKFGKQIFENKVHVCKHFIYLFILFYFVYHSFKLVKGGFIKKI